NGRGVRGKDLGGGSGPAAVLGAARLRAGSETGVDSRQPTVDSWGSKMTRIVVFAYSDTGYECLKFLFERGREVAAVVTHADDPNETRWYGSVAEIARNRGIEPLIVEDPRDPAALAEIQAAKPDLL